MPGYLVFSFLQAQELTVEIEINKDKYLVGEYIWLDVWVTNVSDEPQNFGISDIDIKSNLHIVDSEGKRYKTNMTHDRYPVYGSAPKFPPGEQYHIDHYLPGEFGIIDSNYYIFHFPPGEYTLYLSIKVPGGTDRAGVIHPELKLQSNRITFTVLDPQGEDLEAFQLFKQARVLFYQQRFQSDRDYSAVEEIYQSVINNYPQSPYYELAWRHYSLMNKYNSDLVKRQKSVERHLEFIKQHPDSRLAEVVIGSLATFPRRTKEPIDYKQQLNQIVQDVPDTRAARYVKERLELLESHRKEE